MQKVKNILLLLLIITSGILIYYILSSKPETNTVIKEKYVYKTDTIRHDITHFKEKIDTTFLPGDTVFIPSSNYDSLLLQYKDLSKKYSYTVVTEDSINIDSSGYFKVTVTSKYNHIKFIDYNYKLNTTYITTYPNTKELFIGGFVNSNIDLSLGISYKNDDLLYTGSLGYSFLNKKPVLTTGIQYKIK